MEGGGGRGEAWSPMRAGGGWALNGVAHGLRARGRHVDCISDDNIGDDYISDDYISARGLRARARLVRRRRVVGAVVLRVVDRRAVLQLRAR